MIYEGCATCGKRFNEEKPDTQKTEYDWDSFLYNRWLAGKLWLPEIESVDICFVCANEYGPYESAIAMWMEALHDEGWDESDLRTLNNLTENQVRKFFPPVRKVSYVTDMLGDGLFMFTTDHGSNWYLVRADSLEGSFDQLGQHLLDQQEYGAIEDPVWHAIENGYWTDVLEACNRDAEQYAFYPEVPDCEEGQAWSTYFEDLDEDQRAAIYQHATTDMIPFEGGYLFSSDLQFWEVA